VGLERGPLMQLRSCLKDKVAAPVRKTENMAAGIRCADHITSSVRKVGTNFTDKQPSLGRYSSLAHSGHGVSYEMNYKLERIWMGTAMV
jgi:hypothetical protein